MDPGGQRAERHRDGYRIGTTGTYLGAANRSLQFPTPVSLFSRMLCAALSSAAGRMSVGRFHREKTLQFECTWHTGCTSKRLSRQDNRRLKDETSHDTMSELSDHPEGQLHLLDLRTPGATLTLVARGVAPRTYSSP